MLPMIRPFLALLLILFSVQPLAVVPEGKATDGQKKTNQDKRAPNQTPIVVNVISPDKTPEQAKQEEVDRAEKRAVDKQTIELTEQIKKYTGALVIVGGIQAAIFFLQLIVFGRQATRLRETVESQERSERAILFMGKLEPRIFPTAAHDKIYPGDKDAPWPRIGYCFANLGRTAAIIDRIEVKLILEEKLPPHPGYADSQAMDGQTVVANGGTTEMYPAMFNRHITKAEIDDIRNEIKKFYLFGFARYDDIFGYVHSYSFCFQFLPKTNSVFVTGGEQYNFRHTQKKKYEIS